MRKFQALDAERVAFPDRSSSELDPCSSFKRTSYNTASASKYFSIPEQVVWNQIGQGRIDTLEASSFAGPEVSTL